jgi:hypothetical protein
MLGELTKKFAVLQHESFVLHDVEIYWYPSVLESFLLLNTQFFTVYRSIKLFYDKMQSRIEWDKTFFI